MSAVVAAGIAVAFAFAWQSAKTCGSMWACTAAWFSDGHEDYGLFALYLFLLLCMVPASRLAVVLSRHAAVAEPRLDVRR